jgi:hypothetical protein
MRDKNGVIAKSKKKVCIKQASKKICKNTLFLTIFYYKEIRAA